MEVHQTNTGAPISMEVDQLPTNITRLISMEAAEESAQKNMTAMISMEVLISMEVISMEVQHTINMTHTINMGVDQTSMTSMEVGHQTSMTVMINMEVQALTNTIRLTSTQTQRNHRTSTKVVRLLQNMRVGLVKSGMTGSMMTTISLPTHDVTQLFPIIYVFADISDID